MVHFMGRGRHIICLSPRAKQSLTSALWRGSFFHIWHGNAPLCWDLSSFQYKIKIIKNTPNTFFPAAFRTWCIIKNIIFFSNKEKLFSLWFKTCISVPDSPWNTYRKRTIFVFARSPDFYQQEGVCAST